MRSFFGSILLILVLAALGATIYYHWSTNSHLEFELRHPDEPEKTTKDDQDGKNAPAPHSRLPFRPRPLSRRRKSPFRRLFPFPNNLHPVPFSHETGHWIHAGRPGGHRPGSGRRRLVLRRTSGGSGIPAHRTPGKRSPWARPNPESANYAFEHLEQAAQALREGVIDAVVTAPVCKETLHVAGFRWPGQTEFFAERLETENYAMCLTGKKLTVGLATIHTSLQSVPSLLNTGELVRIGMLLKDFCRRKGISRPRIALAP